MIIAPRKIGLIQALRQARRADARSNAEARRVARELVRFLRGIPGVRAPSTRLYQPQISTVKVSYKGGHQGRWANHGYYIARESAAMDRVPDAFSSSPDGKMPGAVLRRWQNEGDSRHWRIIISPEFGSKMNLEEHTRRFVKALQARIGIKMEWVAVNHYNTDNHHTHLVLRGVDEKGRAYKIDPNVIATEMREMSRLIATQQIGFRSERQIRRSAERQLTQLQRTQMDRDIAQYTDPKTGILAINHPFWTKERRANVIARLEFLKAHGLVLQQSRTHWAVQPDLPDRLYELQKSIELVRTRALIAQRVGRQDIETMPLIAEKAKTATGPILGRVVDIFYESDVASSKTLILETARGDLRKIPVSVALDRQIDEGTLKPGQVAVLYPETYTTKGAQPVEITFFDSIPLPKGLLQLAGDRQPGPGLDFSDHYVLDALEARPRYTSGFSFRSEFARYTESRIPVLLRNGLLQNEGSGYAPVPNWREHFGQLLAQKQRPGRPDPTHSDQPEELKKQREAEGNER